LVTVRDTFPVAVRILAGNGEETCW
jgi:hypothetical protein